MLINQPENTTGYLHNDHQHVCMIKTLPPAMGYIDLNKTWSISKTSVSRNCYKNMIVNLVYCYCVLGLGNFIRLLNIICSWSSYVQKIHWRQDVMLISISQLWNCLSLFAQTSVFYSQWSIKCYTNLCYKWWENVLEAICNSINFCQVWDGVLVSSYKLNWFLNLEVFASVKGYNIINTLSKYLFWLMP